MTEIVARIPRSRGPVRLLLALAALVAVAVAATLVLHGRRAHPQARAHPRAELPEPKPVDVAPPAPVAPLPTAVLDAEAARGLDRSFFVDSRHGVLADARRVAGWQIGRAHV